MNQQKIEIRNNIHPIPDQPALIVENMEELVSNNILIIADLHFGIEHAMAKAGAHVPSQTDKLVKNIINLCTNNSISNLIILGDIKHTVPGTSRQEWFELPDVFDRLAEKVDSIDIIPGNHDGGLRNILSKSNSSTKIKLHPNSGVVLFGLGMFHGHTWPAAEVLKTGHIILAHNHPHIVFVDKLGGRASFPCWVRGRLNQKRAFERYPDLKKQVHNQEIIIMPAFNDLGSGTMINAPKPELLGPILKHRVMELANAKIYLLDGTALGKLKDLVDPKLDANTRRARYSKYFKYSKDSINPYKKHKKMQKNQNGW